MTLAMRTLALCSSAAIWRLSSFGGFAVFQPTAALKNFRTLYIGHVDIQHDQSIVNNQDIHSILPRNSETASNESDAPAWVSKRVSSAVGLSKRRHHLQGRLNGQLLHDHLSMPLTSYSVG